MQQYLNLLEDILTNGEIVSNRTGINTIRVEGRMLEFDMNKGFPLLTINKVYYKKAFAEMLCFMKGPTDAAKLRLAGCNWWDKNANENKQWLANPNRKGIDDLGRVYGAQWRDYRAPDGRIIDQLKIAVETIIKDPDSRRIIVETWNPGELDRMALPPCHKSYQFICNKLTNELSLIVDIRSSDVILGLSTNIAMYALLLKIVCYATAYKSKKLIFSLKDTHIYENHLEGVRELLTRTPTELPKLQIHMGQEYHGMKVIDKIKTTDIKVLDYKAQKHLNFEMAV